MSTAANDEILSHGDVVLLRSDLSLLSGPHFLNDRLLAFYFSHLSLSINSDHLLLLPPSVSFLLANIPAADLHAVVAPLALPSRRLLLLPVNDNSDPSAFDGGSHWSLLVYQRLGATAGRFVHHDSFGGANRDVALRLYEVVKKFVGGGGDGDEVEFVEGPTPSQGNGYDCGAYVMMIAKVICEWYVDGENGGDWFQEVNKKVNQESVRRFRKEFLGLILALIHQKKKKA